MALYSALVPLLEAHQWFKNGDHPEDRTIHGLNSGRIVQRPKLKHQVEIDLLCNICKKPMGIHGFINEQVYYRLKGENQTVCPGDYIVTHRHDTTGRILGYTSYNRNKFEMFYGPYKEPQQ